MFNSLHFLIGFLVSGFVGFILGLKIVVEELIHPLFRKTKDEWNFWVCVGIVLLWIGVLIKLLLLIN